MKANKIHNPIKTIYRNQKFIISMFRRFQLITYDLVSLSKLDTKGIRTGRSKIHPILLDDHIYIFGGWGFPPLKTCER